jgi:hypothetical protein
MMNQLMIMKAGQIRYCNIPEIYMIFIFVFYLSYLPTPYPSREGSLKNNPWLPGGGAFNYFPVIASPRQPAGRSNLFNNGCAF